MELPVALSAFGCFLKHGGSHALWAHPTKKRKLVIPRPQGAQGAPRPEHPRASASRSLMGGRSMLIGGRIWKDGNMWLAESETVDVCTQGRSRKDAMRMLADAFETLIDRPEVKIVVAEADAQGGVTIESNKPGILTAFVLQ